MNSRLAVGLNQDEYGNKVGDVRVAYDQMVEQADSVGPNCLRVMVLLESAYNKLAAANNVWTNCLQDLNCEVKGATLKKMQSAWTKAGSLTDRAETALSKMEPAA